MANIKKFKPGNYYIHENTRKFATYKCVHAPHGAIKLIFEDNINRRINVMGQMLIYKRGWREATQEEIDRVSVRFSRLTTLNEAMPFIKKSDKEIDLIIESAESKIKIQDILG